MIEITAEPNSAYPVEEFIRDYDRALLAHTVPGYPEYDERLRLDDPEDLRTPTGGVQIPFDRDQAWCLADYYAHRPSKAAEPFTDDGGAYEPTREEVARWSTAGVRLDQRQMPVHPYAEAMILGLEGGDGQLIQPGAAVSVGYYGDRDPLLGPRQTADLLLLAPSQGRLFGLIMERHKYADGQYLDSLQAVPGGHVDPEDAETARELSNGINEYVVAALRELEEEVSITVDPMTLTCSGLAVALHKVLAGRWADQRATIHAWPEGEAYAGILERIPDQRPEAKSDAATAGWAVMSDDMVNALSRFSSHGTIAARAIKAYERAKGVTVTADGRISK